MLMTSATLDTGKAIIALVGVLFPPFGVLHGLWLWFH